MPQCVRCWKKQSKLNTGDLCNECFENKQPAFEVDLADQIDEAELAKGVNDMAVGNIVNAIERIVSPITSKLDKLETLITSASNNPSLQPP